MQILCPAAKPANGLFRGVVNVAYFPDYNCIWHGNKMYEFHFVSYTIDQR